VKKCRVDWLSLVVCVVLYKFKERLEDPHDYEFLLVKRDDGKWAIPGGVGGSEVTNNIFDFAKVEVMYDTDFQLLPQNLEELKTVVSKCGKKITIFLSYNIGKYTTIYEDGLSGELFSLERILQMNDNGQIAFNNTEIIKEFILCRKQ